MTVGSSWLDHITVAKDGSVASEKLQKYWDYELSLCRDNAVIIQDNGRAVYGHWVTQKQKSVLHFVGESEWVQGEIDGLGPFWNGSMEEESGGGWLSPNGTWFENLSFCGFLATHVNSASEIFAKADNVRDTPSEFLKPQNMLMIQGFLRVSSYGASLHHKSLTLAQQKRIPILDNIMPNGILEIRTVEGVWKSELEQYEGEYRKWVATTVTV